MAAGWILSWWPPCIKFAGLQRLPRAGHRRRHPLWQCHWLAHFPAATSLPPPPDVPAAADGCPVLPSMLVLVLHQSSTRLVPVGGAAGVGLPLWSRQSCGLCCRYQAPSALPGLKRDLLLLACCWHEMDHYCMNKHQE